MWSQEVIVSNPESQIIVGTIDVVKAICVAVRSFIGTVEAFNHLFERPVFCRYRIVVGKSNDLSDIEGKVFFEFAGEFHCGKRVSTVTVSDKFKVFRELCESLENHTHCKDTGTNTTVVRYLLADNGSCSSIHDEPDVSFDATDFDVSFIGSENIAFFVGILIYKRLDADSGSLTVVGNLLVGNADIV